MHFQECRAGSCRMGKQSPSASPELGPCGDSTAQPSWLWAAFSLEQKVFPEVIRLLALLPNCAGVFLPAAALLTAPAQRDSLHRRLRCKLREEQNIPSVWSYNHPWPCPGSQGLISPCKPQNNFHSVVRLLLQAQCGMHTFYCRAAPPCALWNRRDRDSGDTARAAPERGHAAAEGSAAQVW